jgi:ubiquinone/menaquinone biosynthesis C-methylase UbiE
MTIETVMSDDYIGATGAEGAARLALLDQVYGPEAERIMDAIGILRGGRIADIGCGTGNTTRWFANRVGPEGQVTAVDVSADQLAIAQSKAEADGLANIHFVCAGAYDTGLPRDHFDAVHCRLLLCHLVRPLDALREMAAMARPGMRGERKRLWEYSFFEASPHFVGSGLTSDAELKQLSAALSAVAADETISVAQARMPAAWARKPG